MSEHARRLDELSYFNAIACLLVILIHVASFGITHAIPGSLSAALIYFPWRLAAFVVPAFLFSSAVKMALRYDPDATLRSHGAYFFARVRAIFLPYVGWNIVYYAFFSLLHYVQPSVPDFFRQLITGTLSAPFYYVIIAMQFYLLRPVWFWILTHLRWYIVLPGAVLINFLSLQLNALLAPCGVQFAYADRIFTSYLVFWVVGLYAGRNWTALTRQLASAGKSIAMGGILVLAISAVPYLNYAYGIWLFDPTHHKIFTDLLSIAILLWCCLKLQSSARWMQKSLSFIAAASFSTYLSHCLFLNLAEQLLANLGATNLWGILFVRALFCYSAPFLLYALSRRLRPKSLRHK